jgi:hypothetical protein
VDTRISEDWLTKLTNTKAIPVNSTPNYLHKLESRAEFLRCFFKWFYIKEDIKSIPFISYYRFLITINRTPICLLPHSFYVNRANGASGIVSILVSSMPDTVSTYFAFGFDQICPGRRHCERYCNHSPVSPILQSPLHLPQFSGETLRLIII